MYYKILPSELKRIQLNKSSPFDYHLHELDQNRYSAKREIQSID